MAFVQITIMKGHACAGGGRLGLDEIRMFVDAVSGLCNLMFHFWNAGDRQTKTRDVSLK